MNRNIFANFENDRKNTEIELMDKLNILWADDEIDLLKPHILFLREKGYDVVTVNNGNDAIEHLKKTNFDIVFLDENMPGLSGIETLARLKSIKPEIPVVMITKSEEELIMEQAIGSKIADYLIKPVNPNQILLSLKKNLENKRLISEKTSSDYQQEFRNIGMSLSDRLSWKEWSDVYKKLVFWELELKQSSDDNMYEILTTQKSEANTLFSKFIENNYINWLKNPDSPTTPVMSHQLMKKKILPVVDASADPVFMVLIDNLRYDQWRIIQPVIGEYFRLLDDELYLGILPTATQYARNAIFAGLMPSEIEARFPNLWLNDEEEGGKNLHEETFLNDTLKRFRKEYKSSYVKITNHNDGKSLVENIPNLMQNKLNVIVYNFVDMLSHARTEMEVLKELAKDERAYRSLTRSWFLHSPLYTALQKISEKKVRLFVTTDHGTIRVKTPSRVVGDKETTTNLRYKVGKNLQYDRRDVLEIRDPKTVGLPRPNISSTFIFAKEDAYFLYPNNYNHFNNFYRNTFQHGGISMEELICPVIRLSNK